MQNPRDDEMKQAFLKEFEEWWPFAKKRLAEGGWIRFSIALDIKGRDDYLVVGALECSDKVKLSEAKAGRQAA